MQSKAFVIETEKLFSESLIWQLNRDYYQKKGIEAWSKEAVPHHLTSNAVVGRTYSELIFGFLKDLAYQGQTQEMVYILELGAGHGRLGFHILNHLEKLTQQIGLTLPPFCFILSDIVEDNLSFFDKHPQFQPYIEKGILDTAYFDAVDGKELYLRHSKKTLTTKDLKQPIIAIANYFFDSIPNDLFHIKNETLSTCSISLNAENNPEGMDVNTLINNIDIEFHEKPTAIPFYKEQVFNDMLLEYRSLLKDTYLFFPHIGLRCIQNLQQLSKQGLMLLSMDKGYHELHDIENKKIPEMITHGSISFWVNYHALNFYSRKVNGTAMFPSFSTFHLELACLILSPDSDQFNETKSAYQRSVDDFGPDDFNGFKRFAYLHIARMSLAELIGMMRLSAYDSGFFINILPRLKQVSQRITVNERSRLSQTLHETWKTYFSINEPYDLAFEIGGMFYALGYYQDALNYFQYSIRQYGHTADVFYNRALCHYQLREDQSFIEVLKNAKLTFPEYAKWAHLDSLDLDAK